MESRELNSERSFRNLLRKLDLGIRRKFEFVRGRDYAVSETFLGLIGMLADYSGIRNFEKLLNNNIM